MGQLTKGMYRGNGKPASNLFGLRREQMRFKNKLTHNSGWYNKYEEKIEQGDLSTDDFQRISQEIDSNELFIILSERDSYPNVHASDKCQFIIAKDDLFFVDDDDIYQIYETLGLRFAVLTREQAKVFIESKRMSNVS
ncbi:hypothetical protein MYX07_07135 [Patescibacteria group bacterium AH-259-L07]|nr:hypothetical protein [Patescibacteria group bacterium AH-259-L07]